MEQSMMGSGIYQREITVMFHCDTCEADFELDAVTDDWNTTAFANCETCGQDLELDISRDEFDYDDTYDNDGGY